MSRILDPRTMTYAFSDGSGRITQEQVIERKLLKTRIDTEEEELLKTPKGRARLAYLKLKFLTFFSSNHLTN